MSCVCTSRIQQGMGMMSGLCSRLIMSIVLLSGFASPSLTAFLYNIRSYRPGLPFFHWGDLDAGGLRILAHLRRRLGRVIPLGMDIETFEQSSLYARPLTSNERESLGVLLSEPK